MFNMVLKLVLLVSVVVMVVSARSKEEAAAEYESNLANAMPATDVAGAYQEMSQSLDKVIHHLTEAEHVLQRTFTTQ